MKEYSGPGTLSKLSSIIKSALAGKQNALTHDNSVTLVGDKIGVKTPVKGVYTQEEYDALPETEKAAGMYVISNGGGGSGGTGVGIPSGGIIIWSGTADAVPNGWALCDGTNGTPDLRGRFVLGSSESHAVGSTGGSEEVTLTVAQMPEHSHIETVTQTGSTTGATTKVVEMGTGPATQQGSTYGFYGSMGWTRGPSATTRTSGLSKSHENMPPYYTLAYIMKL